ncbi:leucyl aminopeptidase [Xylophilus sp.]|uniref:leucyl aminopeptidase n=1 Tax=Xylophilus sp. TaxID=2653893 RepID=UPI0013B73317|nr:leucyl aminopeptidase [Xylophilus sp.]KAF1049595.1 MAG: Cytosol aminopeptidase [Xylophilus sp.]
MNFELKTLGLDGVAADKSDALIVLVPQDLKAGRDGLGQLIGQAAKSGDFEAKPGRILSLYRTPGAGAVRTVLAGVGEGGPRHVRQAVGAAVASVKSAGVKRITVVFAGAAPAPGVAAAVQALADASYVYTTTKTKAEPRALARAVIGVPDAAAVRTAFAEAVAAVAGIEFAKEWANRPANHATPALLAQAAKSLARFARVKVEVLGPREVERLGMGAFAAVAQGSEEPLRFIVLRYDGAARAEAPVVLVGKGITFDTGGISIKPAAEMDEMKFDMGGAAGVLGTFRALAELQPRLNVVGLIPATENMPDGRAVKPGDVVTSLSGQTIEILNTDAEGRLVLSDALTYAERFKPRAVIDIATLTGACVIALGNVRSGLFSPDDALADALLAAGEAAQDPAWRLPLDDDYAEGLKSNFADVANVAGRAGGSITAAKFLQRFAAAYPWAHLDIAGTAWRGGAAKGSTGRPVGLLLRYLLDQVGTAAPAAAAKAPARKAPARAGSRVRPGR